MSAVRCSACGEILTDFELAFIWRDFDFLLHTPAGFAPHYAGYAPTPANFAAARAAGSEDR